MASKIYLTRVPQLDVIYKPCKNCGSVNYDHCDTSDDCITEDEKTGMLVLEPKTCDLCDFQWLLSDSDEYH